MPYTKEAFWNYIINSSISENKLAESINVSITTIRRYKKKEVSPHQIVIDLFFKKIVPKLEKES